MKEEIKPSEKILSEKSLYLLYIDIFKKKNFNSRLVESQEQNPQIQKSDHTKSVAFLCISNEQL